MSKVEKLIAQTFMDMAKGLETGSFAKRPKIGVTGLGSEHGEDEVFAGSLLGAEYADVVHVGTMEHSSLQTVKVDNEDEGHKKMEAMLDSGEIDGAVTMHFPFPIGVSTVGRVVTPGKGKKLYIATTTGTSSADRIEGMIKNAIYGIIAAKACGIAKPTVGILNIDGARQTEGALKQLKNNGFDIEFATSARSDGGCVLRGNDLLTGECDVVVCDSLTGNVIIKMMSAYTTGGSFESLGFGYGPGIGPGYDKLVMIISRASGAPVIGGAIQYASELVKGNWKAVAKEMFSSADKAGLQQLLAARKAAAKPAVAAEEEEVVAPPKVVVTGQLAGVEVMDLEDAVKSLWKAGIYAESGMGCTGPIILVPEDMMEKGESVLKEAGWLTLI